MTNINNNEESSIKNQSMVEDMINIDNIIKDNNLTLLNSTPIKLMYMYDQILMNCFVNGIPHYIDEQHCKFCQDNKYKKNDQESVCKKHYALNIYNDPNTRLSSLVLKNERLVLFSRFVKRETSNCTYIFYLTPIHIDSTRFRVFVYPPNIFNKDREIVYDWDILTYPRHFTFSIKGDPYVLNCVNKLNINFYKV